MPQGEWQRPESVTKGGWDYIRSPSIASGYDEFLRDDPLTHMDAQVVDRWIGSKASGSTLTVADFGCGTGRTLIPLAENGHRVIGVDLSREMLGKFVGKAQNMVPPADFGAFKANFVDLNGLKSDAFDHAVCLFSSLGMIRGRRNRAKFLQQVHRTIRPGGSFIVHAHSAMFQLTMPGGLAWGVKGLLGSGEFGDRTADYRGIRDFFIHSFRRGELQADLVESGFECVEWNEIVPAAERNELRRVPVNGPFSRQWRTVGWIVVCKKVSS